MEEEEESGTVCRWLQPFETDEQGCDAFYARANSDSQQSMPELPHLLRPNSRAGSVAACGRQQQPASSVVFRFSAPLPSRRRGSAWTAASAATSRPARAHEGSGRVSISVHTLVLAAIPSPLPPALTKAAACSLSSVSATFRPINQAAPLHPAGPPAVTGRGWWHRVRLVCGGHDGGHRGKGRGSCHLYGSADPVVQDLACCAALVTRPYHVVGHSKRSLAFHQRLTAPSTSQRCGPAARLCMRE